MKMERKTGVGRRQFLLSVGAGAAATTAVGSLAMEARADTETNQEKRKARYKESAHVKAYYRVNRYPNSN